MSNCFSQMDLLFSTWMSGCARKLNLRELCVQASNFSRQISIPVLLNYRRCCHLKPHLNAPQIQHFFATLNRVHTGPGNPGKSLNFRKFFFQACEVMEFWYSSPGKSRKLYSAKFFIKINALKFLSRWTMVKFADANSQFSQQKIIQFIFSNAIATDPSIVVNVLLLQ